MDQIILETKLFEKKYWNINNDFYENDFFAKKCITFNITKTNNKYNLHWKIGEKKNLSTHTHDNITSKSSSTYVTLHGLIKRILDIVSSNITVEIHEISYLIKTPKKNNKNIPQITTIQMNTKSLSAIILKIFP